MQTIQKKGLTVKDLVTIGIFSALFLVFALVGGIFFAPNPVLTFYMPVGSALLCGPVYLLMLAKVQKRWAATILGAIMCIIWFVTGMHWAMALGYLIMGIVADLVAGAGRYRSKKINSLSYILLSLGGTASYVKSLHGDNKLMKELLCDYPDRYTHFQFSILQLLPKAVTPDEVIQTETLWKKKLLTYEPLGMNAN